jgi:hypothetical protein
MRKRSFFAVGVTIAGACLLMAFASTVRRPQAPRPPVIQFVSFKSAGVVDDAGGELAMLTLSISNSQAFPIEPLFVQDAGVGLQPRIAGRWTEVHWHQQDVKLESCELPPLKARNTTLLVPADAEACRICFKYAGAVPTPKHRLRRWVERLPTYVRYRIPWFWNWVGFEQYRPSANWLEGTVDMPLSAGGQYAKGG